MNAKDVRDESYQNLAARYDVLTVDALYQKRADYLLRWLNQSAIPVYKILDLACGTGTMACLLAMQGYQVIAADASPEMLTQAVQKAAALDNLSNGINAPLFLQQSMPQLELLEPVDAVICTLDALNYLTRMTDLQKTFRRVFRWLRPGGGFCFDVNTPYKFQRMNQQLYMDETDDTVCVWRTFFSSARKICTYQVDLFQLRPDGAWDRSFEEHRERAWSELELRDALKSAGFQEIRVCGDLSHHPPKPEEDRWIFTAVRELETKKISSKSEKSGLF